MDDNLTGHSDSDWPGNIDNKKSTTGFCFKICTNSGSIIWASNIQNSIAKFSAEAEVYKRFSTAQEMIYLKGTLVDFNHPEPSRPNLFVDNQACIALIKQTSRHSKTKLFQSKCIILAICTGEVN